MEKGTTFPVSSEKADFRLFLQSELVQRCRSNPRYSMRAFARFLRISPSLLSMVLSGKRTVSERSIDKLGGRLGLPGGQIHAFKSAPAVKDSEPDFDQLSADAFYLIADWYHYAILELVALDKFRPKITWVAKALGISVHQAGSAVERLQRLKLLEITKSGEWRATKEFSSNVAGTSQLGARRLMQKQILEKAVAALEAFPMESRDQSSMTMAIDVAQLPEARERLKKFRRSLLRFFESGSGRDEVFHLSLSLYPVTNVSGRLKKGKNHD